MAKPLPGREYPHRRMSITNKGIFVLHDDIKAVLEKDNLIGYMKFKEHYDDIFHGYIINTCEVPVSTIYLNSPAYKFLCCPMCMFDYKGEHWEQCDSRFEWKNVKIDILENDVISLPDCVLVPTTSADCRMFVTNHFSYKGKLVKTMEVFLGFMKTEVLNYARFGECPGCLLGIDSVGYHDSQCRYDFSLN